MNDRLRNLAEQTILLTVWLCLSGGVMPMRAQDVAAPRAAATFENPVLWEDLADLSIERVGDTYFYSASNMHYSPGAPLLESHDLLHWQYVGHSLPRLDFGPAYDLNGARAYVKGSWASFFGYRKTDAQFYWGGCIEFKTTYLYSAPAAAGPWTRHAALNKCYYDAGLLVDDDGTMYVAYGNGPIHVAQLARDARSEVREQVVFSSPPEIGYIEGSRFYEHNGSYFIFVTHPASMEYVLRSDHGPFGPYTSRLLVDHAKSPINGGGNPHQGGIVDTPEGKWYYMAFVDAFPGGRVPVMAPLTWQADGWPSLDIPGNAWSKSYPSPLPERQAKLPAANTYVDTFAERQLSPEWEWNHNPDDRKWSSSHGLTLRTATVTDDLYMARNTLTHRIRGPFAVATIELDASGMHNGDLAGLALLRDSSAWIGVEKHDDQLTLAMRDRILMDKKWLTAETGTDEATLAVSSSRLWLRISADIRPADTHLTRFLWSTDGVTFHELGPGFALNHEWQFFEGYRFAMFNYATKELGGQVTVRRFAMETKQEAAR